MSNINSSNRPKVQPSITAADLPPALRVFWDTAPDNFKVASILSALACYCVLGTRLRAKYVYDLDPHALLLQIIILASPDQASLSHVPSSSSFFVQSASKTRR